jgi:hypothetical protein
MIAIQSPSSMPVVSSRVLCDVQRKHNNVRDGDNLWDMGSQYYYVDRAYI